RYLGVRTTDEQFWVWDLRSGKPVLKEKAATFDFGPDGGRLVMGLSDGFVVVHDLNAGRPIKRFTRGAAHAHVAGFDPSGRRLAAAGWGMNNTTVAISDTRSWGVVRSSPAEKRVYTLAWSPDGRTLAVGFSSDPEHTALYDVERGLKLRDLVARTGRTGE